MVKNFKKLIADGKKDEAAEIVLGGIANLLSFHIPMLECSMADLLAIGPELLAKLQGPGEEEEEEEPTTTDAPGDDVVVAPAKGVLRITFTGPDDDPELDLPTPVEKYYAIGQRYYYKPATIDGYTVSPEKVSGLMTAAGVTAEFEYTAVSGSEEEETENQSGGNSGGSGSTTGGESGGSTSGGSGGESSGTGGETGGSTNNGGGQTTP